LGGLLDDLLPDLMDAPVELADGARPLGSGTGLVGELGEQRPEILHAPSVRVLNRAACRRPVAGRRDGAVPVSPGARWDPDGRSRRCPAPPRGPADRARPTR